MSLRRALRRSRYGTGKLGVDWYWRQESCMRHCKCDADAHICIHADAEISLWVAKFTVSEFLKRLTQQVWRRSYQIGLQFIRWFLVLTFIGVVIATLSECRPFTHYWQVVPDPGPQCRQGYAQLITMGTSDVITDLLLIVFPIPIVLRSSMPMKR